MPLVDEDRAQFSVAVWYGEHWFYAGRALNGGDAVRMAKRWTDRADRQPAISQVIVADGGDDTVFMWKRGLGIIWPEGINAHSH